MIKGLFQMHDLNHLKTGLEVTYRERLESGHNLANAETPDFKARQTDFRAVLMSNIQSGPPKGEAFQMYMESLHDEEEGFNLEREMKRMSQANLASQAYSRVLIKRYQDLRSVMREGR